MQHTAEQNHQASHARKPVYKRLFDDHFRPESATREAVISRVSDLLESHTWVSLRADIEEIRKIKDRFLVRDLAISMLSGLYFGTDLHKYREYTFVFSPDDYTKHVDLFREVICMGMMEPYFSITEHAAQHSFTLRAHFSKEDEGGPHPIYQCLLDVRRSLINYLKRGIK